MISYFKAIDKGLADFLKNWYYNSVILEKLSPANTSYMITSDLENIMPVTLALKLKSENTLKVWCCDSKAKTFMKPARKWMKETR